MINSGKLITYGLLREGKILSIFLLGTIKFNLDEYTYYLFIPNWRMVVIDFIESLCGYKRIELSCGYNIYLSKDKM